MQVLLDYNSLDSAKATPVLADKNMTLDALINFDPTFIDYGKYPRRYSMEFRIFTPGSQHDRLYVIIAWYDQIRKSQRCLCVCDCGAVREFAASNVRYGKSRSCGCKAREANAARGTVHGMHATPTYRAWYNMKRRCISTSSASWSNYGARGITVCEEWETFSAFYRDMGDRPEGTTLDRIDVNKGYSKDNCRWATKHIQDRNKRTNRYIELNGERLTLSDWARKLGINPATLSMRLKLGWSIERALTPKSVRVTKEMEATILARLAVGDRFSSIARDMSLHPKTVSAINRHNKNRNAIQSKAVKNA